MLLLALWSSAFEGRYEVVEHLGNRKANVNLKVGRLQMNPLHVSSGRGHFQVVKFLLACMAKMDEKTTEGETEFFISCKTGNLNIADELVKRGADLETKNNKGWNALMAAAANGHDDVVKYLMAKGLSESEKNEEGRTALDLALAGNHVRTARLMFVQR